LGLWLWCLAPLSCFITGFVTRLTRQVPLVEQKLPTLPENLRSPPVFLWSSCYSIFSFMCMFCRSLFVLLYFFFCSLRCLFFFDIWILITHIFSIYGFWLPIFFRYMDSDYPYFFDIWILITRIFSTYGFWLPVFFRWILITLLIYLQTLQQYFSYIVAVG
jgi:hypothetical protein